MTETEQFAYGYWHVNGTACPVEAAGLSDDEWATEVAEDFDDLVQTILELDELNGVISKDDAEVVWERLSETTEANLDEPLDDHYEHMHKRKFELIEAVEKEVFSNA